MTPAARSLQSHDLSGEGIKLWITHILFLTTQGHGGPPRMSDQLNAGATSEDNTNVKDNTLQAHTHLYQQGEYGMMITVAKWYSGTLGGLKFPDICLKGEEKPRKNLTQETCPDRGSSPGPLRDRSACFCLSHSDGHLGGRLYNFEIGILITRILWC